MTSLSCTRRQQPAKVFYAEVMKKLQLIPAIALLGIALYVGPNIAFGDPVPACCKKASTASLSMVDIVFVFRSLGLI